MRVAATSWLPVRHRGLSAKPKAGRGLRQGSVVACDDHASCRAGSAPWSSPSRARRPAASAIGPRANVFGPRRSVVTSRNCSAAASAPSGSSRWSAQALPFSRPGEELSGCRVAAPAGAPDRCRPGPRRSVRPWPRRPTPRRGSARLRTRSTESKCARAASASSNARAWLPAVISNVTRAMNGAQWVDDRRDDSVLERQLGEAARLVDVAGVPLAERRDGQHRLYGAGSGPRAGPAAARVRRARRGPGRRRSAPIHSSEARIDSPSSWSARSSESSAHPTAARTLSMSARIRASHRTSSAHAAVAAPSCATTVRCCARAAAPPVGVAAVSSSRSRANWRSVSSIV